MPNLKDIRKRIGSARTVNKITKAMKLVSAAKSRSAQAANALSRPYSDHLYQLVKNLWRITGRNRHALLKTNQSLSFCYLIVAPDKGLCGPLVDNLSDFLSDQKVFENEGSFFIAVGKKAAEIVAKNGKKVEAFFGLGFRAPKSDFVHPIVKLITEGYLGGRYGKVEVFYTSFVSALKQEPRGRRILPAGDLGESQKIVDTALYEPEPEVLLDEILKRFLEIEVYQLILESIASEHSSRMLAMDKASNNAREVIDDLSLTYNKVRQENITRELLEITTAISAL